MSKEVHVAVAGSTGAVGEEMLRVLEKRNFPVGQLTLLASSRSVGKKQIFRGQEYTVQELGHDSFEGVDIALFSAGGSITKIYAPSAVKAGAVVVDNSSAYRMDPQTPLVIPEINAGDIAAHKGIIANPNCSTIIMLMAVYPIHQLNPVKSIIVSTYQAASGAGAAAMRELEDQARDVLDQKKIEPNIFPWQIAFNAFSHNSAMNQENGYNEEELKMVNETRKILHLDQIQVSPTCIRIGTFRAHAESIHLELTNPLAELDGYRKALSEFPGVTVIDDRATNRFPMPTESSGQDDVFVGRLRPGLDQSHSLELFCCGDQILKGAALNAVQIAEQLLD
ncbi:MAG: aspartate-semialdehyde dehydrogenase [Leptospiraceae bacterium]|nr:aspartate-semialdehyde dehydrogenase [Leptospiraceae bacterium]